MRGSLQEQLLNSGLVDKERLEKAALDKKNKNKPKSAKNNRHKSPKNKQGKPKKAAAVIPEKSEVILDKTIRVEIKKLLRASKLNDKNGEIPYNYIINNQVKRFYLNAEQQKRVTDGELVITNWNDRSYLIPSSIVGELHKLHPALPIASAIADEKAGEQEKIDEEYADYIIPDDLTW